ncbi:MAG: 2,3,4,5-tetrahydropyridine-2-carboxylate N-succinyltransferase, partial [Oceanicoccus sp.]
MSEKIFSIGFGVGTQNKTGDWLEVFYPNPLINPDQDLVNAVTQTLGYSNGNQSIELNKDQLETLESTLRELGQTEQADIIESFKLSLKPLVATILAKDENPESVPEGYLKLHLLSHRLVRPHAVNLTGLFGILPNVAWTNKGAIDVTELA